EGDWTSPGRTDFVALNEVQAQDAVRLDSGGAIAVAHADSIVNANLVGRALVANGAKISTSGNLNVGVRTGTDIQTSANAKTYGLSGAASGLSTSAVQATEHVRVGQNAQIETEGSANFY